MPKLKDAVILRMIDSALRERRCDCYVHWEPRAHKELAEDANLTHIAVNRTLAKAFIDDGVAPDIEIQTGGPYDGQARYVWRLIVEGVELYLKIDVQADHRGEPRIDVVRCHKGHY